MNSPSWINIGSLILGQNGIWGDLPAISEAGVERFGTALNKYKQIRDDITRSHPVRSGRTGGSPEIHEKIADDNEKELLLSFTTIEMCGAGIPKTVFPEITEHKVDKKFWANPDTDVTL